MKLKLPLRQRIGVLILLSLGFVVTAAGIVHTYFIWRALIDTYDVSWYTYPLWIAAAVEIDLGLLCACAPALRTFITTYFPQIRSFRSKLGYYIFSKSVRSKSDGRGGGRGENEFSRFGSTTVNSRRKSNATRSQGTNTLPKGVKCSNDEMECCPAPSGLSSKSYTAEHVELGQMQSQRTWRPSDDDKCIIEGQHESPPGWKYQEVRACFAADGHQA